MKKGFKVDYEGIYTESFGGEINQCGVAGYRVKTITAGKQREYEIYPIFKSRHALSEIKARRPSKEVIDRNNKKNAQKRLIRLINENFTEKDMWATFTYDETHLPKDIAAANKFVGNYLRRLAYWMKKNGAGDLKYVFVTEFLKDEENIRVHHHVVMNFPDRDIAESKWKGGSRTQTRRLQPDEFGFEGLGRYITKSKSIKHQKMWVSSKNLRKPKVTISDSLFTKRKAERAARNYDDAVRIIEQLNPKYKLNALEVSVSDFIVGVYIRARLCRIRD